MSFLLRFCLIFVGLLAPAIILADIQDPPGARQGPTRKLSRGIANITLGASEIPQSIIAINREQGNAAAVTKGVVRGVGRTLQRLGYGISETVTFAFPTYKGSYRAPYRTNIRYPQGGFTEMPPVEFGFETRYYHVRPTY